MSISCLTSLYIEHKTVVAPRIELDAIRVSVESGQPALDYHLSVTDISGSRIKSTQRESNPQPREPKSRVLPPAPHVDKKALRRGIEPLSAD